MALTLSIGITENSYSVANNTSSVTVSVNISWTGGSWDHNYYTKYVNIAGTRYDFNNVKVNPNRTTTGSQTLYSTTVTIGHNSDGTGSVYCDASVKTATGSGTVTASNSLTLTTIPRASATRLSASSVNMGSTVTVYTDRASSSFTHYFYYRVGSGSWNLVATGIGDSYTWTVPLSLANHVPSGTSLSVTVNIDTYSGSTKIGSTYNTLTCYVPSSVVPSVSGISVVDNNGYASTFGGYVQGKSVPKITVNASASYSSISQYKVSFQGNSYISTSNVITLGAISQTGSLNITVTVTDARGRTASKTVSITGLAYSSPSLSVSAIRCDTDGTANDEGAYMKVSCMAEIAPIDNKNSKAVTLKYKKKTVTDWTTQKTWAVYSVNENIIISADIDSSYDIQLTAADYFTTDQVPTANAEVSTVAVIMDFNTSGKGMAIGKVSERDGLEVDWEAEFNKGLKAGAELDFTTDEISEINTSLGTSGIKRLATFVKNIAYKLGLIADYVVEEGTSGIWTYEKWNSGILKCYGKEEKALTSASSAWQGGYSCGTQIVDVPFMVSGIYGNAVAQHSNVAYMANTAASGSKLYYLPLFDDPNITRNTTIQYYVVGKWK